MPLPQTGTGMQLSPLCCCVTTCPTPAPLPRMAGHSPCLPEMDSHVKAMCQGIPLVGSGKSMA